jgi:predicted amidophosphoribosyltransferase
MVKNLRRLLSRLRSSGPENISQRKITRDSVADALARKPRRICFASTHQNALKRQEGARWVGSFSVPFPESVYPLFYDMTELELKESTRQFEDQQRPTWWRSVRDEKEFDKIHGWMEGVGSLVFLSDQLALSVSLGEYQTPGGGRSEIGELEYQAKFHKDAGAIEDLIKRCRSVIRLLPYYSDADAICAVPPREGKEFDLPTIIAGRLAKKLDIPDLTRKIKWKGDKPSLKEVPFSEKWDALAATGIESEDIRAKSVVLLDDLYQSGITIQFVARQLLKAGAKQVFGLTLVKSRRDSDNE